LAPPVTIAVLGPSNSIWRGLAARFAQRQPPAKARRWTI
jgi:hypothetical protein